MRTRIFTVALPNYQFTVRHLRVRRNGIIEFAVTVPHAGIVYALGAVTRPGGFVVSNDRGQLTTLKLLALAGGLERTAKSDRAVIVRHDSNGQQHEVEVDLKKVMKFEAEDIRIQPSDVLYIPKSAAKQALIKAAELSIAIGSAVAIYRIVR